MYEGFQVWHLTGHEQELLGGNDVKLHGMPRENKGEGNTVSLCHA